MANFGDILSNISIGASQSVRRNSGNSAFEAFTPFALTNQSANQIFAGPTSGGAAAPTFRALVAADVPPMSIGNVVSGGGANRVLYQDASGNLATDANFVRTATGVGIGTTSPAVPLHVLDVSLANGAAAALAILGGGADGTHGPVNLSSGVYPSATGSQRYAYLQVADNSAGRSLALNPLGGNVGVGTTMPVGLLSVGAVPTAMAVPLGVRGVSSAPALNSATGIAEFYGDITVSLAIGGDVGSPYSMWLQTRQLNPGYTGSSYPLALNPLGGSVGIGTAGPSAFLHVIGTTEQFRIGYDASNYLKTTVGSSGIATIDVVGSANAVKFASGVDLGLFGATPIAQPTTAIAAATFAANTSGIADDTATFDGYTFGQVVKALRNIGLLA